MATVEKSYRYRCLFDFLILSTRSEKIKRRGDEEDRLSDGGDDGQLYACSLEGKIYFQRAFRFFPIKVRQRGEGQKIAEILPNLRFATEMQGREIGKYIVRRIKMICYDPIGTGTQFQMEGKIRLILKFIQDFFA